MLTKRVLSWLLYTRGGGEGNTTINEELKVNLRSTFYFFFSIFQSQLLVKSRIVTPHQIATYILYLHGYM